MYVIISIWNDNYNMAKTNLIRLWNITTLKKFITDCFKIKIKSVRYKKYCVNTLRAHNDISCMIGKLMKQWFYIMMYFVMIHCLVLMHFKGSFTRYPGNTISHWMIVISLKINLQYTSTVIQSITINSKLSKIITSVLGLQDRVSFLPESNLI